MKERLQEYIEEDKIYQLYKENKLTEASDFERFCIQHCTDIESLLIENKRLESLLLLHKESLRRSHYKVYRSEIVAEKQARIDELEKTIKKVVGKLQLLVDIGFDYDGYNDVQSLKGLIDELVSYAGESKEMLKENIL